MLRRLCGCRVPGCLQKDAYRFAVAQKCSGNDCRLTGCMKHLEQILRKSRMVNQESFTVRDRCCIHHIRKLLWHSHSGQAPRLDKIFDDDLFGITVVSDRPPQPRPSPPFRWQFSEYARAHASKKTFDSLPHHHCLHHLPSFLMS